ncbi:phosphoadenylyl-sulfate reductase [Aureibacter tunicatorum]|uniref:Adenosine 5'-phosphosulfate reductase n=1 Tax=Aureibacter tunicatorum TaxID=866807 RepID=A0AAE3XPR8_9BACT|nr:phosphoadenylyl-sulfate reductase [Aureibacter tunicatorum]MDR6240887.1 phosphoadenosine phosphosulfate reductase [Aureibacter tunicatorum]BDD03667.1 phosphoadenylyl-sulfate reductase [Aureibacter tunicatorum]
MDFESIKEKIYQYKDEGKSMFTTSSFQSHSIVLLHILSEVDRTIPVYFINTGYHFPETIIYRDQITDMLGLNLVDLKSPTPKFMQKDAEGKFLFASDPDYCCFINKTNPMDAILRQKDVWINGVRGDQSAVRKAMKVEQPAPHDCMRFHPMLDWNSKMIWQYRKEHNLPPHPLEEKGYMSIGCEPCTRKMDPEMQEREARWYGMNKVECGLHTDLVK